jgi:hypothetical protein
MMLETAVCDYAYPGCGPVAQFHRLDDLAGDGTNWWSPSIVTLGDWVTSAGFTVEDTATIPVGGPAGRAMMQLHVTPGVAEYLRVSYEKPVLLQRINFD